VSFAALAWASKQNVGRASDKLILLAYADRHNEETGCAYPSIAALCEFSCLDRKTVIASVGRLEALGLLTETGDRVGNTKQIKVYSVNIGTVPKTELSLNRNCTEISGEQSQKRNTEPVTEPITSEAKASSVKRGRKVDFEIPDWIPAEPWAAYCTMRARKKAPVDSYIAGKQFRKLDGIRAAGWDIAKVLDKATVNNWTDIFMPTVGRDDDMRAAGSQSTAKPTIAGGTLFAKLQAGEIIRDEFDAERARIQASTEHPPPKRDHPKSGSIAQFIPRIAGAA